ncbi:ABC transporter substrate-binding protein [Kribbella solani]|uniref:Peptide/nickel transport system substrate-binding protein n=1 Tax=Kribbella solani TaxID=236067 RepID=A0A841DJM9_9ACTN|nr:ABC transporter substrate-binding protein [Kribbella solani]MBB5977285.1 peptide/nickel transport system substrate-binding protein [Kribbella solani]
MIRSTRPLRVLAVAAILAVSGCSASGNSDGDVVRDGTFTMAIPSDPGGMNPMRAAEGVTQNVLRFAYDSLVAFAPDGKVEPYLAQSWKAGPRSVAFTLRDGITCSNGKTFTAAAAAATLNFAGDPAKKSDYLRDLPPGMKAAAEGNTVTVSTPNPDQFLLYKVGGILMVCPDGLSDPASLTKQTQGTGMFQLSDAAAGDHYTFTRRDEFVWGPGGVTAKEQGLPKTVVLRVVPSETTAANLLVSGEVNVTSILGPDRKRVAEVAGVQESIRSPLGLTFFNQAAGRPGADQAVRRALTTGMDRDALARVMTDGTGATPRSLLTIPPDPCHADTVSGAFPAFDAGKAAAELEAAGWVAGPDGVRTKDGKKLHLRFIYNSALGDSVVAAAELLRDNWKRIGVELEIKGYPPSNLGTIVYETGDWDAGWLPITVGIPSDFVARLSGPTPPAGANLASIHNAGYDKETAAAAALPLDRACPHWIAAEKALFEKVDVVPVVDGTIPTFGKGVGFRLQGGLIDPTSLRLKG